MRISTLMSKFSTSIRDLPIEVTCETRVEGGLQVKEMHFIANLGYLLTTIRNMEYLKSLQLRSHLKSLMIELQLQNKYVNLIFFLLD